jgi:hypothetical protein
LINLQSLISNLQLLDTLEQRGPAYHLFVAELRQLARRYRTRGIQAALEPYLTEDSDASREP